jgi:hypothetical protein
MFKHPSTASLTYKNPNKIVLKSKKAKKAKEPLRYASNQKD